ncbi:MAG: DegT/DnrJ/EryC1/StrS family aminotransferase [Candidatus Zixiibacteriota bacterium]
MQVPFLDLQAQYRSIKSELDTAIQGVLDKSAYVLGPAVAEFEKNFAAYCQTKECIGINNGTNALLLALKALGVGPGDEVITAANTFIATAAAIAHAGPTPVLVDCDPASRTIDPNLIERAITKKTKVIIPVHLYGRTADMDPILSIAAKHKLAVLEDSAQSHGAKYKGRTAGSMAPIAAFSFYPGKNLGAYGEGGAVTTSDPELARKVRMLRDHGSEKKYYHELLGYNARLEGIQGAVLNAKLRHLDIWNTERNRVAHRYSELLKGAPVTVPDMNPDYFQVFHLYVIEVDRREELQQFLQSNGISTLIHYPVPIHLQKAFSHLGKKRGDFPVTEKMADRIVSLPMFPELTDEQIQYVVSKIKEFFGAR